MAPDPLTSMEGRTIARPNPDDIATVSATMGLQWRAGQLPGQTITVDVLGRPPTTLQWRAGQLPGQTAASTSWRTWPGPHFNGGPDNCPAKPPRPQKAGHGCGGLQWRAGQLPGQTLSAASASGVSPVLQWRAGQLPGQTAPCPAPSHGQRHFNGGPDNCPAKPIRAQQSASQVRVLQWRAGQLPGQTRGRGRGDRRHRPTSMEGRTIARPNPQQRHRQHGSRGTSMEGRTIARPNRRYKFRREPVATDFNGGPDNCPAKPPATATTRPSSNHFNGGPDNCPAKRR